MNRQEGPRSILTAIFWFIPVICFLLFTACKGSTPDMHDKVITHYPLYSDKPFALPDSLHYFYNTIDARGTALSGGEFYVYLKYPVFRSNDKKTEKLVDWLYGEIFILSHNGSEDNAALCKRFRSDYTAYANYTLNSWLSSEETTKMGCMQESLAVEVVLNKAVITMKVHHKGYWGGAHGDDIVRYAMFDKNFSPIDAKSMIASDKTTEFNSMLIAEYKRNIDPWRDYDDNYKINPEYMAFVPDGLIVIYYGYAYAEGQPTMLIKPERFAHLMKSQYRKIYNVRGG